MDALTLGEFRSATKSYPDEAEIFVRRDRYSPEYAGYQVAPVHMEPDSYIIFLEHE